MDLFNDKKFFCGETEQFKIYLFLNNLEERDLHDLYRVKTQEKAEETFLLTSLKLPLENRFWPVFHSSFDSKSNRLVMKKNFFEFERGFVHARNYLQDNFTSKDYLDLVVFDHGFDQSPFPGAKNVFFKSDGASFVEIPDFIDYPLGNTFAGCSGDWDGDGVPELVIFDLMDTKLPALLSFSNNKLSRNLERIPHLIEELNFKPLSGTKFRDFEGKLHLALGSQGDDFFSPNDLVLKNDGNGFFLKENIETLPQRRGGDNWACIEMKSIRFSGDQHDHLLALYHDASVQHGIVELYLQKENGKFSHFDNLGPLISETDSWFYRVEDVILNTGGQDPDSLLCLKSRGLKNFVKKEYNFKLVTKVGDHFVDISEQLSFLRDKEFSAISKMYSHERKVHDLIFYDNHGNYYFCETKNKNKN